MAALRLTNGAWATVYSGPNEPGTPCRVIPEIPARIGVDLGICRPPVAKSKTTITCWKYNRRGKGKPVVKRRPKSCITLRPEDPLKLNGDFSRLRWRNWGRSVATAKGLSKPAHGENVNGRLVFRKISVTLRAYDVLEYDGRRYYTKLRLTTRYGTSTRDLAEPHPGG